MRLPNGYGSVYKLKQNLRNPWVVKKTVGWELVGDKAKRKVKTIGYYRTRKDALEALAEYNNKPWDLDKKKITLKFCYDKWAETHHKRISQTTASKYDKYFEKMERFHNYPIAELKTGILQEFFNDTGLTDKTLRFYKIILSGAFSYAIQNDICDRDYAKFLTFEKSAPVIERVPFSKKEIDVLWEQQEECTAAIALFLLYTGTRIDEALNIELSNIYDDYIDITKSKTNAGIRHVPIHEQIRPIINRNKSINNQFLFETPRGKRFKYSNLMERHWKPFFATNADRLTQHRPHDTRHTFVSRAKELKLDDVYVKKIVGHQLDSVTLKVYTHISDEVLYDEMQRFIY